MQVLNEIGTQSKEFSEVETQTSDQRPSASDAANPLEDPKFYKFVMRAVPLLERELELAARSRAFDGYKLLEDEADLGVQKLHILDNNNNNSSSSRSNISSYNYGNNSSSINNNDNMSKLFFQFHQT